MNVTRWIVVVVLGMLLLEQALPARAGRLL